MHPKETLIVTGQDINLTCSSTDAANSQLQWSKRSPENIKVFTPINHSTLLKDYVTDVIKTVLVIRNATVNDSAVYACLLTHAKNNITDYVELNVKGKSDRVAGPASSYLRQRQIWTMEGN